MRSSGERLLSFSSATLSNDGSNLQRPDGLIASKQFPLRGQSNKATGDEDMRDRIEATSFVSFDENSVKDSPRVPAVVVQRLPGITAHRV